MTIKVLVSIIGVILDLLPVEGIVFVFLIGLFKDVFLESIVTIVCDYISQQIQGLDIEIAMENTKEIASGVIVVLLMLLMVFIAVILVFIIIISELIIFITKQINK